MIARAETPKLHLLPVLYLSGVTVAPFYRYIRICVGIDEDIESAFARIQLWEKSYRGSNLSEYGLYLKLDFFLSLVGADLSSRRTMILPETRRKVRKEVLIKLRGEEADSDKVETKQKESEQSRVLLGRRILLIPRPRSFFRRFLGSFSSVEQLNIELPPLEVFTSLLIRDHNDKL